MMGLRFRSNPSIALLILASLPASLSAQAVLLGRTISDSTRDPLAGVEVAIDKLGLKTESDGDGEFTLANIDWGVQSVVIRKIGYRPVRLQLIIASDDTVRMDIRLRMSAVELPPLEVTATSVPRGMEEFARRRLSGWGTYFDAKQLRQADHRRVSDLLRGVRGVRPITNGFRTVLVSSRSNCAMAVWLDGIRIFGSGSRRSAPDIDQFSTFQLEAIEVYSGPAETPHELAGFGGAGCGAVALWTRRS